jgi:hypothetical protein
LIEQTWANEFAKEWIDAWNSRYLDRILSHYVDDFEMSSPLIIELKRDASGVLRGKTAIRDYWAIGLAAVPPIQFELIDVHEGIDPNSVTPASSHSATAYAKMTWRSGAHYMSSAAGDSGRT